MNNGQTKIHIGTFSQSEFNKFGTKRFVMSSSWAVLLRLKIECHGGAREPVKIEKKNNSRERHVMQTTCKFYGK